MNHRVISASFVGIWESPLQGLPELDRRFCLDFFGDPYYTNTMVTPEGFVISKIVPEPPVPNVLINPNRIQITTTDVDSVVEKSLEILEKLSHILPNFHFPFSSIGINSEQEWINLPFSCEEWMYRKFFAKEMDPIEDFEMVRPYHIRLEIKKKNSLRFNLFMEPRSNSKNAIFIGLNDDKF